MSYPLPRFLDLRTLNHEQGGGWSQQGLHQVWIPLVQQQPYGGGVLCPPLYRFDAEGFGKEAPVCLQPGLGK